MTSFEVSFKIKRFIGDDGPIGGDDRPIGGQYMRKARNLLQSFVLYMEATWEDTSCQIN